MASETRQLPKSNESRIKAIDAAVKKNGLMGAGSFLTLPTKTRLAAIQTSYRTKYDAIALTKNAMVTSTVKKNDREVICRMFCSHFIQVFNLGVERGKFKATDRTFYKLDVSSNSLPPMASEADLTEVAKNLIKGEADRIAAGGVPMSNPDISEVNTAFTNYDAATGTQSTAVDAYDQSLEDLDKLNTEADAVIKKVWDEVETFYNEEDAASQRDNAREWGVVYVLTGSSKKVSGLVLDVDTNLPIEGAEVFLENGVNTSESSADGSYSLSTTLMNKQALLATHAMYNNYSQEITLEENQNLTFNVLMKKAV